MKLDSRSPTGPIEQGWSKAKFEMKLVNPANKRKYKVIVVGSGLAGGAAAATLAELGYDVACFCFQDSPRRAHSIAAQGGINAAKNYQNDGDSRAPAVLRHRQGRRLPVARSRTSTASPRCRSTSSISAPRWACRSRASTAARWRTASFGGAQVSRTFYARGQTGQQLLLGVYSALERQIGAGKVKMFPRTEMLDVVVEDGRAVGIVVRDLVTGAIASHSAHAVILATGGYGNVFYLSTNAKGCNVTATYRAYKKRRRVREPVLHADPPDLHPGVRRLPVQAHADVGVAAQRRPRLGAQEHRRTARRRPSDIPDDARDYYLERKYPSFGNLSPRDIASRAAKEQCDDGRGVGPGGRGVYLDFRDAIKRDGRDRIAREVRQPVRDVRADHRRGSVQGADAHLPGRPLRDGRAVGRLPAADHHPGPVLPRRGELLRPRREPARRQRADAGPRRRLLHHPVHARQLPRRRARDQARGSQRAHAFKTSESEVKAKLDKLLGIRGKRSVDSFHKELGHIMWENCGMARSKESLETAISKIPTLRQEFWADVTVQGSSDSFNQSLEKAGRVADFLEFGELMCNDALVREESCGGHFRVEHQIEGEAKRDDENFCHAAVWEYQGEGNAPARHTEPLVFDNVKLATRSYK